MWHKAKKVSLTSGQTDVKLDFPLPIVACNLMIEYADFYENMQVRLPLDTGNPGSRRTQMVIYGFETLFSSSRVYHMRIGRSIMIMTGLNSLGLNSQFAQIVSCLCPPVWVSPRLYRSAFVCTVYTVYQPSSVADLCSDLSRRSRHPLRRCSAPAAVPPCRPTRESGLTYITPFQASSETLQCPRCSASVPAHPGVWTDIYHTIPGLL